MELKGLSLFMDREYIILPGAAVFSDDLSYSLYILNLFPADVFPLQSVVLLFQPIPGPLATNGLYGAFELRVQYIIQCCRNI